MCNKFSLAMVILKKKPAPLKSQCLSEHLQERVRGMFARELGAARQLTEEVPQHPANARKINTAREVRLRVRLSATWTKNRATDFTRVPGVWFFARQRTPKIYFQWENNRQIIPRSQKQDCLVSYMVSAHTFLLLNQKKQEALPDCATPRKPCIKKARCFCIELKKMSGRQDSNLRPPGPKPGALPDCATPRKPCICFFI